MSELTEQDAEIARLNKVISMHDINNAALRAALLASLSQPIESRFKRLFETILEQMENIKNDAIAENPTPPPQIPVSPFPPPYPPPQNKLKSFSTVALTGSVFCSTVENENK